MSQNFLKTALLRSTILVGVAAIAAPAFAQTAATDAAADEEIIVTGTLIKNPNLERSAPVLVTTSAEIELKQSNVAEEVLRDLPGVVPNVGSAVNNGNNGASYVDLRGLGSNRNIVLLDGNRIAPSNLVGRVDLNNIPLALVERVETLTGAASTTYGADAVTGVVNFITKQNFQGVDLAASEQITEKGDGNIFRADLTIGGNFDDGKGNVVVSVGYQEADPLYQGDRAISVNNVDSYTGAVGGGSGTGVPARFSGTRPTAAGVINTTPESIFAGRGAPTAAQPLGVPIYTANPGGAANGGLRQIDTALGQAVNTFAFFNFNPYNIFQTPFKRFNIFAQAKYEVADNVEVYSRGMFSKNTVNTIIAPSGSFGAAVNVPLSNPYLPAAVRNQFCAFDVNPRPDIYTPRFTPAECAAAATVTSTTGAGYREIGTGGFVPFDVNNDGVIATGEGYNPNPQVTVNRRTTEVGPRISEFVTQMFDYRIGARGSIGESMEWDINASYGESENLQTQQNYVLTSRLRQALLATNTTTCLNTTNGCVPLNIFGPDGSISSAMAGFLTAGATTRNTTSLAQVRGTVGGDIGWAVPAAADPISFAIGNEYRRYRASQNSDLLSQTAGELGGAGGAAPNINGGFVVYESFAEVVAPLVQDKPFFDSLTLEAGVRYSTYKIDAPTKPTLKATTYKVGGSWEPGEGVKIRGNFSRAVRAPNINELFAPVNTGLTNLGIDPCAGAAPTTNANLRAICIAQGASVGFIGSITNPTAGQANATAGGNINLKPEKADTYTIGTVLQPTFVPGLSLTLDYYRITVNGAVSNPLPGDVIAACFGNISAASATDPNCTVIRRNPLTGGLDGDPATTAGLFLASSNVGRLQTDGIDLSANYSRELGFAKLGLSFTGNYTMNSKFRATPTALNRECTGFYSPNCSFTGSIQPKFQWSQRTTLSFDQVDVSLLWRHIDGVEFEPQQLADDLAAALTDPTGCPAPTGADAGGCMVDPAFRQIGAADYFDLSARVAVNEHLSLTATVSNLLNKQPPQVGSLVGSTSYNSGNTFPSTYDALGRKYAMTVRLKF